jgi:hypothetical protein
MVGQFFTPEWIVQMMYRLARARAGQSMIDPSCGDGAFVKQCLQGAEMFACELDDHYGLEVSKLLPVGNLVRGDALTELTAWNGKFDLVIGNPPFSGRRALEARPEVLQSYELGVGRSRQRLEILFLELFVRLTKPGGRIAIILPEGLLGNAPLRYVREWLLRQGQVELVLGLPRHSFANTSAKTAVLVVRKLAMEQKAVPRTTWLRAVAAVEQLAGVNMPSSARRQGWTAVDLSGRMDWRPEAEAPSGALRQATVALGSVAKLRRGAALYGRQRELHLQGAADRVLLLRAKNLDPEGGLRIDPAADLVYISRGGSMFRPQAIVKAGEILFVRVGARCYGRTALVPLELEAQADDWLLVITPVVKLDAVGLVSWMNSAEGRASIQLMAKGVGSVSIAKSALATLQIPRGLVDASK